MYSTIAVVVMIAVSLVSPRWVVRLAIWGMLGALTLTALTLVWARDQGRAALASLPGMSLPAVRVPQAVPGGGLRLADRRGQALAALPGHVPGLGADRGRRGAAEAAADIGMLVVIMAVFLAQVFVRGSTCWWWASWAGWRGGGRDGFPVPRPRALPRAALPRPEAGDNFQVRMSMEAFGNGGLLGRGPARDG
jgi:cell division protein FtsW